MSTNWKDFLEQIADEYYLDLDQEEKDTFLSMFAEKGTTKSVTELALALNLSESGAKARRGKVYDKFPEICPRENGKRTRVQASNLQVWLNQQYSAQSKPRSVETTSSNAIAIDYLQQLEQLERESKVRCIERWQAAGVSESEAIELADDSSIGTPPPHIQPCAEKLILLIGELGAGKSLIGERLFQIAIKQAKENANAPIPVYLEAKKVVGHLQEAVEAAATGIGNPQIQGATVIIDGADEAGTGLASQLSGGDKRPRMLPV